MTSTASSFKCDYLGSHTPSIHHAVASEHAARELVHLNEQINSLDSHISQLKTWRRTLQHHSYRLHNMLSPIYTLPVELLSRIFQQLIFSPSDPSHLFLWYRTCLSQSFVLRSVSAHFRDVALDTPQLWTRVPIFVPNPDAIVKSLSLLQYCMALTTGVNVSVFDRLLEREAYLATDTLLTSDTMSKIKAFELEYSPLASHVWTKKLEGSSFPMLNALSIHRISEQSLNFGAFKSMTRLSLYGPCYGGSLTVIVPLSVQYLTMIDVPQQTLVSLLYRCPNLVECFAAVRGYISDENVIFDKPLTLTHLKRLAFHSIRAITSSAQIPLLPSLKTLQLRHNEGNEFTRVIPLCRNVSATLTTLKIHIRSNTVERGDLDQLWKISFPNLKELELQSRYQEPLLNAIQALTQWLDEYSNTQLHYLPSLALLFLHSTSMIEPRWVLGLLNKWEIGEAGYFHVKVRYPNQELGDWSPELREKLGSIVGNRRIGVIWGGIKVRPCERD